MKLKAALCVVVLSLISIITAHAQGLPCGGDDPDATCPLDTWVIVFALSFGIFAAVILYRRKNTAEISSC